MIFLNENVGGDYIEVIRMRVLKDIWDAKKIGRKPKSIVASPNNYHLCLIAFMHQVTISEKGVELLGVPFIVDHGITDIQVHF
ncbi:MAG: hypothetical protein HGA77_00860 [Chlorobiaceae bacterium]|nr:hypothetical protein [Chlorobiaceae bacterium]